MELCSKLQLGIYMVLVEFFVGAWFFLSKHINNEPTHQYTITKQYTNTPSVEIVEFDKKLPANQQVNPNSIYMCFPIRMLIIDAVLRTVKFFWLI